jgi:hypothetical protein
MEIQCAGILFGCVGLSWLMRHHFGDFCATDRSAGACFRTAWMPMIRMVIYGLNVSFYRFWMSFNTDAHLYCKEICSPILAWFLRFYREHTSRGCWWSKLITNGGGRYQFLWRPISSSCLMHQQRGIKTRCRILWLSRELLQRCCFFH